MSERADRYWDSERQEWIWPQDETADEWRIPVETFQSVGA